MAAMNMKTISSTKMKPMQDFLLVKPHTSFSKKSEEVTETGLVLELEKKNVGVNDRPTSGIILELGPDCKHLIKGMEIFWDITRGQDIELKDGEFMMLMESSVIAYRSEEE